MLGILRRSFSYIKLNFDSGTVLGIKILYLCSCVALLNTVYIRRNQVSPKLIGIFFDTRCKLLLLHRYSARCTLGKVNKQLEKVISSLLCTDCAVTLEIEEVKQLRRTWQLLGYHEIPILIKPYE